MTGMVLTPSCPKQRSGIYPDHILFYYNKCAQRRSCDGRFGSRFVRQSGLGETHRMFQSSRYYKKALQLKNYGVETVEELAALVSDTVVICPPKVLSSK